MVHLFDVLTTGGNIHKTIPFPIQPVIWLVRSCFHSTPVTLSNERDWPVTHLFFQHIESNTFSAHIKSYWEGLSLYYSQYDELITIVIQVNSLSPC